MSITLYSSDGSRLASTDDDRRDGSPRSDSDESRGYGGDRDHDRNRDRGSDRDRDCDRNRDRTPGGGGYGRTVASSTITAWFTRDVSFVARDGSLFARLTVSDGAFGRDESAYVELETRLGEGPTPRAVADRVGRFVDERTDYTVAGTDGDAPDRGGRPETAPTETGDGPPGAGAPTLELLREAPKTVQVPRAVVSWGDRLRRTVDADALTVVAPDLPTAAGMAVTAADDPAVPALAVVEGDPPADVPEVDVVVHVDPTAESVALSGETAAACRRLSRERAEEEALARLETLGSELEELARRDIVDDEAVRTVLDTVRDTLGDDDGDGDSTTGDRDEHSARDGGARGEPATERDGGDVGGPRRVAHVPRRRLAAALGVVACVVAGIAVLVVAADPTVAVPSPTVPGVSLPTGIAGPTDRSTLVVSGIASAVLLSAITAVAGRRLRR